KKQHIYYYPNPDIEITMRAQVLNAPKKSIKNLITNQGGFSFYQFLMHINNLYSLLRFYIGIWVLEITQYFN
ncbi:MAG: hypothetical protein Q9M21_07545, partial [Mariprofundaceae bacterium]|nr:hypothetical protein [Mariprofundaceae bacterium]